MRLQVTTPKANISRRGVLAGTAALGAVVLGGAYAVFAQSTGVAFEIMDAPTAHEAANNGEIILVDIRTPEEWAETGVGEGAIALNMLAEDFVPSLVQLRETYPNLPIAMICRTGNRSDRVTTTLAAQGFTSLIDVKEGMVGGRHGDGWLKKGLPIYAGTPDEISARLKAVLKP